MHSFQKFFTIMLMTVQVTVAVLLVSIAQVQAETTAVDSIEAGKRIYREGILPSGQPLKAIIQSDIEISGSQLNCMSCHRRSGFGSSESGIIVPPITGTALWRGQEIRRQLLFKNITSGRKEYTRSQPMRPAYNEETLAQVIRDGIDSSGRKLHSLMPRYIFSELEIEYLTAYLKSISDKPSPGVTDTVINFATVITEGVDPGKQKAMVDVLESFFHDRSAEGRGETIRAKRGAWHRNWRDFSYRAWKLHIWKLSGPRETWREQLDSFYQSQPVFALIGGIGTGSWQPIHNFCEANELACLFPTTDYPFISETNYYNLYFNKGVTLEANALAKYLTYIKPNTKKPEKILQVFHSNPGGSMPVQALNKAMQTHDTFSISQQVIEDADTLTAAYWQTLIEQEQPSILVLWLDDKYLHSIDAGLNNVNGIDEIYISGSLIEQPFKSVPKRIRDKVFIVHPYALPELNARGMMRTKPWLRTREIESPYLRLQANTLFSAIITGMAIKRMLDNYSRNYMIEKMEHMVENTQATGAYPRLSLGPGQRFASKGVYIGKFSSETEDKIIPASQWITP